MINGTVTANREAVITLDVIGSNQKREKVGMSLLYGNRLIVDILEDGDVAIELLP